VKNGQLEAFSPLKCNGGKESSVLSSTSTVALFGVLEKQKMTNSGVYVGNIPISGRERAGGRIPCNTM